MLFDLLAVGDKSLLDAAAAEAAGSLGAILREE